MRIQLPMSVLALAPAALNVSTAAPPSALIAPLCSGGAASVGIILPQAPLPVRGGEQGCCIKGCHVGGSRKRSARDL